MKEEFAEILIESKFYNYLTVVNEMTVVYIATL